MAPAQTEKIRNVAFVGHVGAGKTTLVDELLHQIGTIGKAGRVEDGTTVSDYEPEEHARNMSIRSSVVQVEWEGHRLNLIDTPGFLDFEPDARAALHIADLAVFVIGATDGVGVQTQTLWDYAKRIGVPRMFFVNKLDAERADFDRVLDELRVHFGEGISLVELPIGQGSDFHGVVDLEDESAFEYDGDRVVHHAVPDELAGVETAAHEALVESVVLDDDAMLEHYLEGQEPSYDELVTATRAGVAEARLFPVMCGSALTAVGVDRLASLILQLGPSPVTGPARHVTVGGSEEVRLPPDPAEETVVFVFKTISDDYVGQLSVCRVLTGTLMAGAKLTNTSSGTVEHPHTLLRLRGATQMAVDRAPAGDIVALPKLANTRTGDTLTAKGRKVAHTPAEQPDPVIARAVTGHTPSDDDKLSEALQRICAEDPTLRVERADDTRQTLLRGMGPTHLDVAIERMARRFHVNFDTADEQVGYRETATVTAEAEARHKKQSGGHGQFAVVSLRVEPLARGEGFRFDDEIVGGAIPRHFLPAVERGVQEAMAEGGPSGFPVVDVAVTCLDGKAHSVDSSDMAFKLAARSAFRAAMAKAEPAVLEPLADIEVIVPSSCQGDVLSDLTGRRGRVRSSEPFEEGYHRITAVVPAASVLTYIVDLRGLTGGRGRFRAMHRGFDVAPSQDTARLSSR